MDGGGRLLRSLGEFGGKLAPAFALAGSADPFAFPSLPQAAPRLPRRSARRRASLRRGIERLLGSRLIGTVLVIALFGVAGFYGTLRGGAYDAFVASHGAIPDVLAKSAGFAIKAVTITGAHELSDEEVLKLGGVSQNNSLVFLDVAAVRARLKAVPLIKEASVSKLFPNRLLVEIEERQPDALWQKDGVVSIVSVDGTTIDDMRDTRFERLPLVVGEGANRNIPQYEAILDAAGDMREHIRAGIYVSGRRWTLKTNEGLDIDLPENDPADAVGRLSRLEHDGHILEKDVVSLDLRVPGRVVARLSADAAAARADVLAKKSKKKGATT
jgi:cell division protein FtsQ